MSSSRLAITHCRTGMCFGLHSLNGAYASWVVTMKNIEHKVRLQRLLPHTDCFIIDASSQSAFAAAGLLSLNKLKGGIQCFGKNRSFWHFESKTKDPGPTRRSIVIGFNDWSADELLALRQDFAEQEIEPISFFGDGDGALLKEAFPNLPEWMWFPGDGGELSLSKRLLALVNADLTDPKSKALPRALIQASEDQTAAPYPQLKLFEGAGFEHAIGRAAHNLARQRWNKKGEKSSDAEEGMLARVAEMIGNRIELDDPPIMIVELTESARGWSEGAGYDASHIGGFIRQHGIKAALIRSEFGREEIPLPTFTPHPLASFGFPDEASRCFRAGYCWRILLAHGGTDKEQLSRLRQALRQSGVIVPEPRIMPFCGAPVLSHHSKDEIIAALKAAEL